MPLSRLIASLLVICLCRGGDAFTSEDINNTPNEEEIKKGCGNFPADVIFVLDESSSIWGPHFDKQKLFVEDVVEVFDISYDITRIGVLMFADQPRVIMELGEFNTEDEIQSEVARIRQVGGNTGTADALRRIRRMFRDYGRPEVSQVAIVITDGESDYPDSTEKEAQLAHEDGLRVFAIGVGSQATKPRMQAELHKIASEDQYVNIADSYDSLASLKDILGWKACQVSTTTSSTTTTTTTPTTTTTATTTTATITTSPPPQMFEGCVSHRPIDVVFSLSDQAGIEESALALDFVNSVISEAEMSPQHVQAGLTPRNCFEVAGIKLNQNTEKTGFMVDVERRKLGNLGCFTDMQLSYLSELAFSEPHGGRQESVKIAVVIVDNHSVDLQRTIEEAQRAKKGMEVIVIGVGPYVDRTEVTEIASGVADAFFVDSYAELAAIQRELMHALCRVSNERGSTGGIASNKLYDE